jgi:hypothetical protein
MTVRNALETPSIRQRVGEQEWQARVEPGQDRRRREYHGAADDTESVKSPDTEDTKDTEDLKRKAASTRGAVA